MELSITFDKNCTVIRYLHSSMRSMNFFKILVPLFKSLESSLSFTELAKELSLNHRVSARKRERSEGNECSSLKWVLHCMKKLWVKAMVAAVVGFKIRQIFDF